MADPSPPIDGDANDRDRWEAVYKEVEALRQLHGDAICDAEKCRDFNRRMAELLMSLEEMGEDRLADRAMDALSVCNPKTGTHCENSERMKGILERLAERVAEMAKEKADLRP
jgi:hypothetical protein